MPTNIDPWWLSWPDLLRVDSVAQVAPARRVASRLSGCVIMARQPVRNRVYEYDLSNGEPKFVDYSELGSLYCWEKVVSISTDLELVEEVKLVIANAKRHTDKPLKCLLLGWRDWLTLCVTTNSGKLLDEFCDVPIIVLPAEERHIEAVANRGSINLCTAGPHRSR